MPAKSEPVPAASARAQEIRQAAGSIFLEKGYSATTMNDIATAVGILPGSLYHHFESKEAAAVEILGVYNAELHDLGVRLRHPEHLALPAEMRIRELSREVALLSQRHAAAVRLRGFDPPTTTGENFRAAIRFRPTSLYRLWHSAATDLPVRPDSGADLQLLTHTLQVVTTTVSTSQPAPVDPEKSATIFCDSLLQGIAVDCPDDDELNNSAPMKAAVEAIANWRAPVYDDELKSQIVATARQEFARRGYESTTIRDIVAASGIRMGTVYRRVSSMESIFEEITLNYSEHLNNAARAALTTEPGNAIATVDALAQVIIQANQFFPDETRMMSLSWSRPNLRQLAVHEFYRAQVTDRMALLIKVLNNGRRSGQLHLPASAIEFSPHLRSILWVRPEDRARASARRKTRFVRNHLLRGVLPTPSS